MKYRAIIKKSGKWWIGWLIDLPGVNAQEKTIEKLIDLFVRKDFRQRNLVFLSFCLFISV